MNGKRKNSQTGAFARSRESAAQARGMASSPAAKAASLVLAAGLALPTVMPTLAHAQDASGTQDATPSLQKAADPSNRTAAALIR